MMSPSDRLYLKFCDGPSLLKYGMVVLDLYQRRWFKHIALLQPMTSRFCSIHSCLFLHIINLKLLVLLLVFNWFCKLVSLGGGGWLINLVVWNVASQILRCGPPPMNKAMAAHLDALEYSPDMQFQFWLFSPIGHSMNGQGWWETFWIFQAWDWLTLRDLELECEIIDYPMMRIEILNLTVW